MFKNEVKTDACVNFFLTAAHDVYTGALGTKRAHEIARLGDKAIRVIKLRNDQLAVTAHKLDFNFPLIPEDKTGDEKEIA